MLRGLFASPSILTLIFAAAGSASPAMSSFTAHLNRRPASIRSVSLTCQQISLRYSLRNTSCHNNNHRHGPTAFAMHHAATTRASSHSPKYTAIYSSQRILPLERPPDPSSFSSSNRKNDNVNNDDDRNERSYVENQAQILRHWMMDKKSIVCLTGAGMSTESGIPDYRGSQGSYFRGHKPVRMVVYSF